jgi:predicted ATPase
MQNPKMQNQNIDNANRFVVLTGGPGSGKSSLIEALHHRGHARSVEAGRAIIQEQMAIGGRAVPWEDPTLFAELMLSWEMRSYDIAARCPGTVFFDRGMPDVIGYVRLIGLPVPPHMQKAAETLRYNRRVFIAPAWREIFHTDEERKQSFDEAVRTYDAMVATYNGCGYELIEIPRVPVEERVRFVLKHVREAR